MVNPDVFSDLAETKPLEASLGDSVERCTDQLRTPLGAISTNHLVDSSGDGKSNVERRVVQQVVATQACRRSLM
jgi:hypothetical protein